MFGPQAEARRLPIGRHRHHAQVTAVQSLWYRKPQLLRQHLNLLINIHLSYQHKGHLTHSVLKLSHVTPESIQRKPYFTCVSICLPYGQVRVNLLSNHAPKDGCKRGEIAEVERQKTTGGLMLHLPFYR